MALSERLAFLITVNDKDAVKGLQNLGKTAEKELGKADARLDKLGSSATKVGAGMLAFSGVAAGALLGMAKASEEAQRSQLLLNNTLANAPKLAGETADAFNDLADEIQGKTAADGDQVVSAMAMLGTFQLTGDEIRNITPLVVDFAQKFGVDLTSAAVQVGKALDGQVGALKRNGVSIDENLYKTDRFAAVQKALREQVGGFAEQEGATLSGRLERLRNELGDVTEGLGVGVVGALESALKPATAFSDWLGDASPETQEFAGRLLAIGTAGVGAVGGLSLIAGQLIKVRDRFTAVDAAGTRSLNTMGKFAKGAGIATGLAGVAVALYEVAEASNKVTVNVEEMSRTATDELVEMWQTVNALADAGPDNIFESLFQSNTGGIDPLAQFQQIAEGSIGTAKRLRDAIKETGEDTSDLDKILRGEAEAQRRASADTEKGADALDDLGDGAEGAADGLERVTGQARDTREEIEDLTKAMQDQLDITNELIDAGNGYEGALNRTEDALKDYWKAGKDAKEQGGDNAAVTEAIERATLDAAEAILAQSRAAVQYVEDLKALNGETVNASEAARIQREDLQKVANTLAPSEPLRQRLDGYIGQLAETEGTRIAKLEAQVDEAKAKLHDVDNLFKSMEERHSRLIVEPIVRPVRTAPLPEDQQSTKSAVEIHNHFDLSDTTDPEALAQSIGRVIGWSLSSLGGP